MNKPGFNWCYFMESWPGKKPVPSPLYSTDEKKCQIVYHSGLGILQKIPKFDIKKLESSAFALYFNPSKA